MRSIQALSLEAGELSIGAGAELIGVGIDGFSRGFFGIREFQERTRRRFYHIIILACRKIASLRNKAACPGRALDPHVTGFGLRRERLAPPFLSPPRRLGVDFVTRQHTDKFLGRVFSAAAWLLPTPLNNVPALLVLARRVFDRLVTLSA